MFMNEPSMLPATDLVRHDDPGVCICGCGPAGALLGLLLARTGIRVLVLEKHADFLRDFRGDTIHPSTLELLDELGLAERFLRLPHTQCRALEARTPGGATLSVDFSRVGGRFPFIAFVPQWDFLEFITAEAARYPGFRLIKRAEVVGLVRENGSVRGVRYRTPVGEAEARALLVVGADGRESVTRKLAGLRVKPMAPEMDVLWFRLSRRPTDPENATLQIAPGHMLVLINRREYWQIAYAIPKGHDAEVRTAGLAAFQHSVAALAPDLADRVSELTSWDGIKLLTVRSDRLVRWYAPGYLAIGDAAHAMSPVGGIGINVAIQDAVAAANLLWKALKCERLSEADLRRVQRARELPVRFTQWWQALLQKGLFPAAGRRARPDPFLEVVARVPILTRLLGRFVAFGVWRPHVASPLRALPPARTPLMLQD
jgi:2-polyprenyl-6-methoxyphenol hydroxylase-like FAD-dependent oxidoreductase